MTFDPHRVSHEHGLMVDELEQQVELWDKFSEEAMNGREEMAYRNCAEKVRQILDTDEWDQYICSNCGEVTRASSLPPYCPVCEEWGVMESTDE